MVYLVSNYYFFIMFLEKNKQMGRIVMGGVLLVSVVLAIFVYAQQEVVQKMRIEIDDLKDELARTQQVQIPVSASGKSEMVTVFTDTKYGFSVTAKKSCAGQFAVKKTETTPSSYIPGVLSTYSVFVPLSKTWLKGYTVFGYNVMPQSVYKTYTPPELEDRQTIIEVLKNGNVLTISSVQDGPTDVDYEGCGYKVNAL